MEQRHLQIITLRLRDGPVTTAHDDFVSNFLEVVKGRVTV
jgi:hypothetical protein